MVMPPLPVQASQSVTVSDLKTLRQLAESGQLKSWQAGALLDVVVSRREGGLLMVDTGKGLIGLPVPDATVFKPGTALQLQVLALAPLQIQLRPAPANPSPTSLIPLPATLTAATALTPGSTPPLPLNNGALMRPLSARPLSAGPAPHADPSPGIDSDPVVSLARAFSARLAPLLTADSPALWRALPARLGEWLSRQAPAVVADEPGAATTMNPRPGSADWARLSSSLLGQWPDSQGASEPDELSQLLRQALFGEPAASAAGAGSRAGTDWLGSLARLLFALPNPAMLPGDQAAATAAGAKAPANTAANLATAAGADDDNKSANLLAALAPPDDLIDDLASVLGRQQQHWLNNLQADPRQQPLYAELLLRHGERLDPFELSVREEAHSAGAESDEARHHVVRLRFDLPGLGVCQFLLDLNADDLQLHFYSEHTDTVTLFNEHLDELARTLAADAIHLTAVQSHRVEQLPHLQQGKEAGFHVRV